MKSTGIVRKVDELGRIVLPIEIRKNMNIDSRDAVEIFVDEDKIMARIRENSAKPVKKSKFQLRLEEMQKQQQQQLKQQNRK